MEGVEDLLPTTPAQSGMLFETLANPEGSVNLGLVTARLPADLEVTRYQEAWAQCTARHQSLRSHFAWEGLSAPVHVIRQEAAPTWEMLDWRETPEAARDGVLADWRRAGLALDGAPVLRLALAQIHDGWLLIWACHHALIDDWSMDVVLGEVEALYQGQTLPEPMLFRDYADWLAAREEDADPDFWTDRFEGIEAPTRLAFPAGEGTTGPSAHVSDLLTLTEAETQALSATAQELRVTLAALLTTVWSIVVSRISDTPDVTLGLAATKRSADLDGSQSAVGNFVATLPLRASVLGATTLRAQIKARADEALQEQDLAPPYLAELLDPDRFDAGQTPFDTILSIKEVGKAGYVHQMHLDQQVHYHSSFALAMIMRPGRALSLTVLANPQRLDAAARAQVLSITRAALRAVPEALDLPCCDLPVADAQPLAMNGAPLPDHIALLPDLIAGQDPAKVAITDPDGSLSYGDLNRRTTAFAAQLYTQGVRPGDRVGVLLPRGANAIAAFLATWRLGAAYVPLDPAQPETRLRDMESAAALSCTLTNAEHSHIPQAPLIADPSFEGAAPRHNTQAKDVAYVMFTSGSTGVPKGVVINQGNLAASTAARPIWYADTPERFMVVSPFGFDSSVAGIYWTLSEGGTLVVPDAETVQDPAALCALIVSERVTHTLCLPSLYDLVLDRAEPAALDSLRCTIVAGEACSAALVRRHHQLRPGMRLVNEYGPTEATVWCVASDLLDQGEAIPIGQAIPGVSLMLRDGLNRTVPDGLPGLLYVSGPGVTTGYFNAPEATAQAITSIDAARWYATGDLVRRRPDGQLVFLGRQDDQVKIRGHRIELSEVETVLRALPGVAAAAAVPVPQAGRLVLVGYLCGPKDPSALGGLIRARLPGAYCPTHVVCLDALPQTVTGKVNRNALIALGLPALAAADAGPLGETEEKLTALWQDLLDLPQPPGVETDFFALGGDSLLAMRLVGQVSEAFEHPLRVADMMGAGLTIRTMARLLETPAPAQAVTDATWPAPANPSQKTMWLAARMNQGQPFFHLTLAVEVPKHLSLSELHSARDALANLHDILRCRFHLQDRQLMMVDDAPEALVALSDLGSQEINSVLETATSQPFDLINGPLWRINAWHDSAEASVVQLMIHHTISDGWSLDVLMQDLVATLLQGTLERAEGNQSFANFLAQPAEPSGQSIDFWSKTLAQLPAELAQFPTDRAQPARAAPEGHLLRQKLTADISEALKDKAAQNQTSIFVLLWAALGHTLQGLTGNANSLVAVSHANRPARGFDRTIGCFTKALPYPLTCTPTDFETTLRQARQTAVAIQTHDDIDLEHLELPANTSGPLYLNSFAQIALQYNDFDWTKGDTSNVRPIPHDPTNTSVFEVSIAWSWQGDQLECAVLARAELFDLSSVEAWVAAYFNTLAQNV